jgi:hypothetical protein
MAVYNVGQYRPANKYLRPASPRYPLVSTGKRRPMFFPPPDYRSIERGSRGATLLVVSRLKQVRVCYYQHTTRLVVGWYSIGEYQIALADAREYIRIGILP